ncbi:MAG: hypothetical protein HXS54_13530 [Theionarchaea archaeon]|nr:hypothetical protein [Theionarchaea archaeon]
MYAVLISVGMNIAEPCLAHCFGGYVPKAGGHCSDGNNPSLRNTCSMGYIPGVLP